MGKEILHGHEQTNRTSHFPVGRSYSSEGSFFQSRQPEEAAPKDTRVAIYEAGGEDPTEAPNKPVRELEKKAKDSTTSITFFTSQAFGMEPTLSVEWHEKTPD